MSESTVWDGEPVEWTRDEEARAKRKVDLIVVPLLMLGFFCLQLDRGNIANALTDNFLDDVGITQNQFNRSTLASSFSALGSSSWRCATRSGIDIVSERAHLQIPSNIMLYRVGPQQWLSVQVVAFGLVSTFQAFQSGYSEFLATRCIRFETNSDSRGRRYAGVVLTQSINFTSHPLNVAWMLMQCRNAAERAVAMAMIIMAANGAGIYGAQLLRSDDAPRYHRAFVVMVVLLSAAVLVCLAQWAWDRRDANRREEMNAQSNSESPPPPGFLPPNHHLGGLAPRALASNTTPGTVPMYLNSEALRVKRKNSARCTGQR